MSQNCLANSSAIISNPDGKSRSNLQVAKNLRRSEQQRVQAQPTPEGIAYTSPMQRKNLRGKTGRVKKQKAAMFAKLRTTAHLKTKVDLQDSVKIK